MRALFLKNWRTLRKGNPLFLAFILVYILIGAVASRQDFIALFSALLCALVPKTVMAFDERSGWQRYSATLPLSRALQVQAIYLLALASIALGTLLFCGIRTLLLLCGHPVDSTMSAGTIGALMLSLGLLTSAFHYPFLFRFGLEKGRSATMLVCIVIFIVIFGVSGGMMESFSGEIGIISVICLPVSALLWLGSMLLSVRLYEKRDL